ncbi:MAG: NUDIX hydrolase [Candidatus Sungbacteria bacterium]|nr:NUDIX hydrolase [Candidatus Sungbacteria bacterium]
MAKVRVAKNSCGSIILRLTRGEESMALVFNTFNVEFMYVPVSQLHRAEYKDRVIEIIGDQAIVSFDQRTALGMPFGKHEDIDGDPENPGTWADTAKRETKEETGSPIEDRIYPDIFYKERPNQWSEYFTVAFLANGVGFHYQKDKICDPFIQKDLSKFYRLDQLPIGERVYEKKEGWKKDEDADRKTGREKHRSVIRDVGTYYAHIRRLFAILLQLRQPILTELGRPDCENADDLVQMVLRRIHYRNLFSQRMIRMLISFNRLDILASRLQNDQGGIKSPDVARRIVENFVLYGEGDVLENSLFAVRSRLRENALGDRAFSWMDFQKGGELVRGNFDQFVESRKLRKEKKYLRVADEKAEMDYPEETLSPAPESGEYVEEDNRPDDEKLWLRATQNVAKL